MTQRLFRALLKVQETFQTKKGLLRRESKTEKRRMSLEHLEDRVLLDAAGLNPEKAALLNNVLLETEPIAVYSGSVIPPTDFVTICDEWDPEDPLNPDEPTHPEDPMNPDDPMNPEDPIMDIPMTPCVWATAMDSTTIDVGWDWVDNAMNYRVICESYMTGESYEMETYDTMMTFSGLSAGTEYSITVYAISGSGMTSEPGWTSVITMENPFIDIPTIPCVWASAVNSTTIDVGWDCVCNAMSYRVVCESFATEEYYETETFDTMITFSGLSAGTEYSITVYAISATGMQSEPGYAYATTLIDSIQPTPPVVTAEIISNTEVTVFWNSPEAASYSVSYTDSKGNSYEYGRTYDCQATFNDLTPSETYTFYVYSISIDELWSSEPGTATVTLEGGNLETPVVTASAVNASSIAVSWNLIENASYYTVEYKADGASEWTLYNSSCAGTSVQISNLDASTLYHIRVSAGAENFDASDYGYAQARTNGQLAAPVLTAQTANASSVKLNWDQVTNAEYYRIEYRISGTGNWLIYSNKTTALFVTLSNLSAATDYEFRVYAAASAYLSSEYAYASAATALAAPKVSAASSSSSSMTVQWNAVYRADSYIVEYQESGASEWTVYNDSLTETTAEITGLNAVTSYKIRVQAVSSELMSSAYGYAYATTTLVAPKPKFQSSTLSSISVKWNAVSNAKYYAVEYQENGSDEWTVYQAQWTETEIEVSGLSSATVYKIRVCAGAENYLPSEYGVVEGKTKLETPSVTAQTISASSITVCWNEVTKADSYVVSYLSEDSSVWRRFQKVTGTSVEVTGLKASTRYQFSVVAGSEWFADSDAGYAEAQTALAAPVAAAEATSDSTITVRWNAVTKADSYVVEYQAADASEWTLWNGDTSSREIELTGLNTLTQYNIRVKAMSAEYQESAYGLASETTWGVLDTPAVTAEANGSSVISVRWNAVSFAEYYSVEYKAEDASGWTIYQNRAEGTSIDITGLQAITRYQIRVSAGADRFVDSEYGYASAETALESPTVTATAPSASEMALTWSSVPYADSYRISYRAAGSEEWIEAGTSVQNSYSLTDLAADSYYDLRVCAESSQYKTSNWTTVTAKTLKTGLLAPTLTPTVLSATSVQLDWNAAENAENYDIQYKAAGSEDWSNVGTLSLLSFTVQKLSPDTEYEFRICSKASDYENSPWKTVSAVTLKSGLEMGDVSSELTSAVSIALRWDTVNKAEYYFVEYRAKSDSEWTVLAQTTETSAELTNLEYSTYYYIRVCAGAEGYENSDWDNITETTLKGTLSTPEVTANTLSASSIQASWAAVENASAYTVFYRADSQGEWKVFGKTQETETTVTGLEMNTTYQIAVEASDLNYFHSDKGTAEAPTLKGILNAPDVAAIAASEYSIDVTLRKVENAEYYVVEYQKDGEEDWISWGSTQDLTMTIYGLERAVQYNIRAQAYAQDYETSAWGTDSAMTLKGKLDKPNISAEAINSISIRVTWDAVENAEEYFVKYQNMTTMEWKECGKISDLSVVLNHLTAGTVYDIYVQAIHRQYVASDFQMTETTTMEGELEAPVITANAIDTSSIALQWEGIENATSYAVRYKEASAEEWIDLNETSGLSMTVSGLEAGTVYVFGVQSRNEKYTPSDWGTAEKMTYRGTLANPNLTVSAIDAYSIQASWQSVKNADAYLVKYRLKGNEGETEEWIEFDEVKNVTVVIDTLDPNTEYEVAVQAIHSEYLPSEWVIQSAKTLKEQLTQPVITAAEAIDASSIRVTWEQVEHASAYSLKYQNKETGEWFNIDSETTELSTVIDGLAAKTEYDIYVQAKNEDYLSSEWGCITAMTYRGVLDVPSNITVENLDIHSFDLRWDPVENAASYYIEYAASDGSVSQNFLTENVFLNFTDLNAGVTLNIQIIARAEGYKDSQIYTLSVTTLKGKLEGPSPVSQTLSPYSFQTSWTAVANAESYVIQYCEGKDVTDWTLYEEIKTSDLSATMSDLTPETEYTLRIRSQAEGYKDSDWVTAEASTIWNGYEMGKVYANALGFYSIRVSWTKVEVCENYYVQYRQSGSTDWIDYLDGQSVKDLSVTIDGLQSGTYYEFRVCAESPHQYKTPWKLVSEMTVREKLSAPSLSGKGLTASSVKLNWYPVNYAAYYKIEYRENGQEDWIIYDSHYTGISAEIKDLATYTKYDFRVCACADRFYDSDWSQITVRTLNTKLATPSIKGYANSSTSIYAYWDTIPNAEYYRVYYKEAGASNWSIQENWKQTSFELTGLTVDTTYIIGVNANAEEYESSDTAYVSITTYRNDLVIENLAAEAKNSSEIFVSWNTAKSGGIAASSYEVQYRVVGSEDWESKYVDGELSENNKMNITLKSLQAHTSYEIRVQAFKTYCDPSEYAYVTAQTFGVMTMPEVTATVTGPRTVNLRWESIQTEDGLPDSYTIRYRVKGAAMWTVWTEAQGDAVSVEVARLLPDTAYEFSVQAHKYYYDDSNIVTAEAKTLEWKLKNPSLSVTANYEYREISVSWGPGEDETNRYRVEYQINGSWQTLYDLTPDTSYRWMYNSEEEIPTAFRVKSYFYEEDILIAESYDWTVVQQLKTPTIEFTNVSRTSNRIKVTVVCEQGGQCQYQNAQGEWIDFVLNASGQKLFTSAELEGLEYLRVRAQSIAAEGTMYFNSLATEAEWLVKSKMEDDLSVYAYRAPYNAEDPQTAQQINISWRNVMYYEDNESAYSEDSDDPNTYEIYVKNGEEYTLIFTHTASPSDKKILSYTFTGNAATEYTFKVVPVPSLKYSCFYKAANTCDIASVWTYLNQPTVAYSQDRKSLVFNSESNDQTSSYKIERSADGQTWEFVEEVFTDSSDEYVWTLPSGEYFYRATAYKYGENSILLSQSFAVSEASLKPLVLENVSAATVDSSTINVQWDLNESADSYLVKYRTSGSEAWTEYVNQDASPIVSDGVALTNLQANAIYEICVQAVNESENGYDTQSAWVMTSAATLKKQLAAPNVMIFDTFSHAIDVAWNNVENASSYTLEMKKSSETDWTLVASYGGTGTYFTVAGLEANTAYDFRVKAQADEFADSEYGYASETTRKEALETPAVTVDSVSASSITIHWDAVANATRYEICYGSNEGQWILASDYDGTSTTWTLTSLDANTDYHLNVRAFADGYESSDFGYAEAATLKKQLAAPNVMIFDTFSHAIDVAWNNVENASSYTLEMKKSSETDWSQVTSYGGTGTYFTVAGLEANTAYDFRVKAQADEFADSEYGYASETTRKETLETPAITVDSVSASSITIHWDAIANATRYEICYGSNEGQWILASDYDGTSTTWTLTGLDANTDYHLNVRAFAEGYESSDFGYAEAATASEIKVEVAIVLTDTAPTLSEQVELSESLASIYLGQTLYSAIWMKNIDGSANGISGGYLDLHYDASAFTVQKVTSGTYYSMMNNYYTLSDGAITLFGGMAAMGQISYGTDEWVLLGYVAMTVTGEGNSTVLVSTPTMDGETYEGLNIARNIDGVLKSSQIKFGAQTIETIQATPLTAPTNFTVVTGGANRAKASWDAVENASGYTLSYSTDAGTSWVTVELAETSYQITGLTYGASVSYKVMAKGNGAEWSDSAYSNAVSLKVCPMDIGGDGVINLNDYAVVSQAWFSRPGSSSWNPRADIDGDGIIGPGDFTFLSTNWQKKTDDPSIIYPAAKAATFADSDFVEELGTDLDIDWDIF